MTQDQRPSADAASARQMYFDLHCDSPATRHSIARAEGRCDWPSCGFRATVMPEHVASAFRGHLRLHPGIDHIVFTATGRPRSRPYLEAHLVEGRVHVKVAPLHNAEPRARAIVHHLHTAITDAFNRTGSTTIEVTTDIGGLTRLAQTVVAQAPADSADARKARSVLGLLHDGHTDTSDVTNE
ncbi:hypothetical protein ACW9HR_37090 [Nocardia gipuzkoensis]